MNLSKMMAQNKTCVCIAMTALGAAAGLISALTITSYCCESRTLACKAKKAFKAAEEKLMP